MSYTPVVLYTLLVGLAWIAIPHPAIVVAAGIAPVIIVQVFKYPFVVCLGFIIFSFFRIHEVFPVLGPLRIPNLLALGSLAVLGYHLFIVRDIQMYWSEQLTWFSRFFVLIVIGLVFATDRPEAFSYFTGIYVKIGIMTFAIAWLCRLPKDFILAARLLSVSGMVVAIVAMTNKANGIGLVEGTRVTIGRDIGSVLGDPNDLSLVLLFPTSFAVSFFLSKALSKTDRLLGLVGFFTIVSGIIATQSRGGLLGILSICGFFAWQKVKSKMLLISGGAILGPILLVVAGISDRSSGGAHEEGIDESSMGRIYAWQAAFGMALANPLTGVGLNNFIANYFAYSPHWDGLNHAVHSTWFGIMGEAGFLGFGVFITLLVSIIRGLLALRQKIAKLEQWGIANNQPLPAIVEPYWLALLAGFASFCVSGTFLTQGFTWPFYVLMSLSVGLMKYIDVEMEDKGLSVDAKPSKDKK